MPFTDSTVLECGLREYVSRGYAHLKASPKESTSKANFHVCVRGLRERDATRLIFDLVEVHGLAELPLTQICILSTFDHSSSSFLEFYSKT